jgi:hypothetical protein
MALVIMWTTDTGIVESIAVDASISEGYEHSAEVTEHPVERGAAIADHVRPNNGTVVIEGIVTNAPITVPTTQMDGVTGSFQRIDLGTKNGLKLGEATVLKFDSSFDRVRRVNEAIQGLITDSVIVEIHTGLETLVDMVITRFKVDRNAESGSALPFVLECKRVRIVDTTVERVPAPVERRGRRTQQRGNQTAQAQPLESVAHRGVSAARRALGL